MKKILIITYYWPPSGGAGVQRWVKFVKYLKRFGYDPFVLTVDPKYATYPQIDESLLKDIPEDINVYHTKSFELYSLYKKVSSNKEVPYGGFVNTKKLNFKEKVLRAIRGNLFIPDPRKGWNRYAVKEAKKIIQSHNIDTVVTTSPPHSTQLIGLKLKKQLNIKWIVDFRDPWTDIYYYKDLYPTFLATSINKYFEKKVIKYSDKIITVSPDFKQLFASKIVGTENKIEVIPNGFDSDDFKNISADLKSELFYISHIGTIAKNYDIEGLIKAFQHLPKNLLEKIRLRFIGKVAPEIIEKFRIAGLENNIELIGYVSHKRAIEYMFSSDMLLLVIPKVENNEGIVPGKLFEYMASKKSILALASELGDVAKIIEETRIGIVSDYSNYKKIESFILSRFTSKNNNEEMIQDNTLTEKYSRENLTRNLINVIENLTDLR